MPTVLFTTHPAVAIDPAVTVPDWPLNGRGQERMRAITGWPRASRIRTIGPAVIETAVERDPRRTTVVSRDDLCLTAASSLSAQHLRSATAERPFRRSGTDGSNSVPSSKQSVSR